MVLIRVIDGRSAPIIICDECHNQIVDFNMGIVRYDTSELEEGQSTTIKHSHKGHCDRLLGEKEGHGQSEQLADHLLYLLFNCGVKTKEQLEHARERWEHFHHAF